MDISKKEAQRLIDARKESAEQKKNDQSRLEAKIDELTSIIKKQSVQQDENSLRIDKVLKYIQQKPITKQKNVTMTDQARNLFESFTKEDDFFVHSEALEMLCMLAANPITRGIGYFKTKDFGRDLFNFIKLWTRSALNVIKQVVLRPIKIGFKMLKVVSKGLTLDFASVSEIIMSIMRDCTFLIFATFIMFIQFQCIEYSVMALDAILGSSYSEYVHTITSEYMNFLSSLIVDAFMLGPRILGYLIFGTDDLTGTETTKQILQSDMKLWYIVRGFMNQVFFIIKPVIKALTDSKAVRPFFEKGAWFYEKVSLIFNYLVKLASASIEAVVKTAAAGKKLLTMVGSAAYKKILEIGMPDLPKLAGSFPETVKSLTSGITNRLWGMASTSNALPAPSLRPYTALTACGILGITKAQFDKLQNKKMVQYANDHPLNALELYHVVYHAHREMNSPTLRF